MPKIINVMRWTLPCLLLVTTQAVTVSVGAPQQPAQQLPQIPRGPGGGPLPPPTVKPNATMKLSEHVYLIPDGSVTAVPNIGLIVGTKASLVIDTGLGPRNGQVVVRELSKVSKNADVYLASTHFHPEHIMGESAFPASAKIIRSRIEQKDLDELGAGMITFFNSAPEWKPFMVGATYRPVDILFDGELGIDLGGVRVLLIPLGPAHTRGDTGLFVEGDRILFAGDVVPTRAQIGLNENTYKSWPASLERLRALSAIKVVPAHGEMADGSVIDKHLATIKMLQARIGELKTQGKTSDEASQIASMEVEAKYPGWVTASRISGTAKVIYAHVP